MKTFHLPDLGEGLQEAEIVDWHVNPGDQVVADQPLVSVETDKAVVEVPSPRSGRIGELFGAAGDIVKVGAPLVTFQDAAATDAGTVVGEIPASEQRAEEATAAERAGAAVGVKATPAVRALARRKGVDLALVSPSGPNGVITVADVERAAADLVEAGPLEPLRGVRRAMATRMAHAHAEVVPATVSDDALFVPVLRDVANRAADDLRRGLERMRADILARKIPPEELRGATITLSNFGTLSGRYAAPVVVPPQVAILSTGRIASRVVAADGRPAVHKVMPLSLTFDHRVVTGGEATRFLAGVIADLERPG